MDAYFSEQFTITGSDNSDGRYPGIQGTKIAEVFGQEWSVSMQWNDEAGSDWQPSDIKRSTAYSTQEGLVVALGADDDYPSKRDGDYNDLILVCKSLDPTISATFPAGRNNRGYG